MEVLRHRHLAFPDIRNKNFQQVFDPDEGVKFSVSMGKILL